jgi:hypothetical protein
MPGGFSLNPILPAFALLRLVDEGALLPRVGSVSRFPETLLTAANWIEPLAPLWSFTSMIRQANEKEIHFLWNRAYVATLHRDTVDRLFDLLLGSLEQSIQHLATNPGEVGRWTSTFSERQVKLASELLSRLSIRSSEEQRERLFDLAKSMYEMPLFREHPTLLKCPQTLFARLLLFSPRWCQSGVKRLKHQERSTFHVRVSGLPMQNLEG